MWECKHIFYLPMLTSTCPSMIYTYQERTRGTLVQYSIQNIPFILLRILVFIRLNKKFSFTIWTWFSKKSARKTISKILKKHSLKRDCFIQPVYDSVVKNRIKLNALRVNQVRILYQHNGQAFNNNLPGSSLLFEYNFCIPLSVPLELCRMYPCFFYNFVHKISRWDFNEFRIIDGKIKKWIKKYAIIIKN